MLLRRYIPSPFLLKGEWFLGAVAFTENVIPTPPAELVLLPLAIMHPQRARWLGVWTSITSSLGAAAGYVLGWLAFAWLKDLWPSFGDALESWLTLLQQNIFTTAALLALSAVVHVPPSKVACVVGGAAGVPFWLFIGVTTVVRSCKFLLMTHYAPIYAPLMQKIFYTYKKWILLGAVLLLCVFIFLQLYT